MLIILQYCLQSTQKMLSHGDNQACYSFSIYAYRAHRGCLAMEITRHVNHSPFMPTEHTVMLSHGDNQACKSFSIYAYRAHRRCLAMEITRHVNHSPFMPTEHTEDA